jgi:hypothetical protein
MALGRRVHEIRMILGNVAALSEPAMTGIVPPHRVGSPIVRSLAMISEDFSTRRGELPRCCWRQTSTAKSPSSIGL